MPFFTPLSISAYVSPNPSGSKTGSHPKSEGPRAGTMRPGVRPTKTRGGSGSSGPREKAKMHWA